MYSGGSHRTSPLSKSDALLAFAPGLHRRSLLVPKRSTLLLRCTGAKVGRLEGWKAKLYMTPLKRSIFRPKFRIRLSQVVERSNKSWSEDFQLFQPDLEEWNAKLKVATWPCQVGHIGITTRISSSAALNLRHTSSSAKDGPAALSSWESQVMF